MKQDPILGGPKAPLGEARKGDPNPAVGLPLWARARPHPTGDNPKRANERRGVGHSITKAYPPSLTPPPTTRPLPTRYQSLQYHYARHFIALATLTNCKPKTTSSASRNPRRKRS